MVNWKSFIGLLLALSGLSFACGRSVDIESPPALSSSVPPTMAPSEVLSPTQYVPPTVLPSLTATLYVPPPVSATPTRYIPGSAWLPPLWDLTDPNIFANWYFTYVWQKRNYDQLWTFQTPSFQNQYSPSGFKQYTDWWQSVDRVDVKSVHVLQNDGQYASIQVTMTIYLLNGQVVSERQYPYDLVYSPDWKTWMFDYR